MGTLLLLMSLAFAAQQQQAEWYKDLADFTKSPTEHVIIFLDVPIRVRAVRGNIQDPARHPLPNVIFEIRGPGSARKMRRTETDKRGRLKIPRVPEGIYRFKATLNGFKSIVGMVVVTKKAKKAETIELTMDFGT